MDVVSDLLGTQKADVTPAGPDVVGELVSGAPKPAFMGPREVSQDTEGAADVHDVAIASLANDPKAQIRYYAQEMNIPEDRFGIVGGQISYLTDDGKLQAVDPGILRSVAKAVGPSIPATGGALGTVAGMALTSPTGPGALAGAAGGGVAGASGGQFVREGVAKALMGQEMSAARVAGEGALDLAATTAGLMVGKGLAKAAATRAAREFTKAMKSGGMKASDALKETLEAVNKRYGTDIKLTPAEISNAAKLRAQQIALGNDPEVGQQVQDFAIARGRESEDAFLKYLMELSPQADRDIAGDALSTASGKALKAIKAERVAKGSPIYQRAFKEAEDAGGVDISKALAAIDKESAQYPPARKALEKIHASLMPDGKPVTNLEYIQDSVKEQLDDAISKAQRKGANKLAGRLKRVQNALLDTLDEQVPAFKEARATWGDLSAPVTRAEGGILPSLAKKTEKDFEYLGARFLKSASPAEIRRAKSRIMKVENGQGAWDATLRGYLETEWEQAGRIYKSTIGRPDIGKAAQPASVWATLMGNPQQKARLKAAMTPKQFHALENLMDVFEATGRALQFNSTTAAQLEGREAIKGSGVVKSAATAVADPVGIPRRMGAGVEQFFDNMNAQTLVDVITTTDSVKELLKIGSRNTTRDRAAMMAAKAINIARSPATSGPSGSDDFLPPAETPRLKPIAK